MESLANTSLTVGTTTALRVVKILSIDASCKAMLLGS